MKTLIRSLTISVLIATLFLPLVNATHFWRVDISTPNDVTNKDHVQLDYTVLSTDEDSIDLDLSVDGTSVESANIPDGDGSGRLVADLLSDGEYNLEVVATNKHDEKKTFNRTITRDTVAPANPSYDGSERTNGEYEVSFSAGDNDTERIYLFSSTSPTFTANESTYEDDVEATGDDQSITYEAPSSSERFHAVIAVDRAGNISEPVGDPETDVETIEDDAIPAPGASTATTANTPGAGTGAADADGQEDGEVAGETDEEDGDTLSTSDQQDEGEVAGEIDDTTSAWWWLLLVAALGAAGYLYYRNRQKARTL